MMQAQSRTNRSAILGTAFLFLAVSVFAAAPDIPLDKELGQFDVRAGADPFRALCQALKVPCGEELISNSPLSDKSDPISLASATPKKVLDEIVRRHPEYAWAVRNGVLNMEPKARAGEDYLSHKLDSISIKGDSTLKAALDVLNDSKIPFGYQGGRLGRYARINLDLKDISVRDALNAVVAQDGEAMWACTVFSEPPGVTFQLSSWKKSGVLFSEDEQKKVKAWMKKKKAK